VINALRNFFGVANNSKASAKSRLHFVLVQDRAGLSSEELTQFRKELVQVIEKFFVIDEQGFDINYKRDNETTTLLINSPIVIKRVKARSAVAANS
jgi:cell division topological specificity factor